MLPDIEGKVARNLIDAVGLVAHHPLLCLLRRTAAGNNTHIGRGINTTDEFSATDRARLIDDNGRHLAHHFVGIYPRIEQRIGQWHEQDEYEDARVVQDVLQLTVKYVGYLLHGKYSNLRNALR